MTDESLKITVMGCGGSGGVPYAGNVWGACDPTNPKNYRTRPSLFIEKGKTRIVIDTGPDFRTQINAVGLKDNLDAVLYTHDHVDHILGIDDLKSLYVRAGKKRIPIYAAQRTLDGLQKMFAYLFKQLNPIYPPIAESYVLPETLNLGDLKIQSFDQQHGSMVTTGFRIGDFGYSTDVSELSGQALDILAGVKVWIVGAHPTVEGVSNHAGYNQIKKWVSYINPERTYLTHLNAHADYNMLCAILPPYICPAYDGLEIILK